MRQSQRTSERPKETDDVHKRALYRPALATAQARHLTDVGKVLLADLVVWRPQTPEDDTSWRTFSLLLIRHRHARLTHSHPHYPDIHHRA